MWNVNHKMWDCNPETKRKGLQSAIGVMNDIDITQLQ